MLIAGGVKKKKARALQPSPEHAEQRLELARMRRQAKAYETGMAYKSTEDTLQNVIRAQGITAGRLAGGAGGAALGASARNAQAISNVISQAGTKSRQIGLAQSAAAGTRMDTILQRKDELQLLQQSQMYAEAAQLNKAGWSNLTAGLGGLAGTVAGAGAGGAASSMGGAAGGTGDLSTPTGDVSVGDQTAQAVADATGGSDGMTGMTQSGGSGGSGGGGKDFMKMLSDPAVMAQLLKVIGASGGCWVAREVYGHLNPQWVIFREWLYTLAPKWLLKIYLKYGERFALFISNKPTIKKIIKHYMDKATLSYLKTKSNPKSWL